MGNRGEVPEPQREIDDDMGNRIDERGDPDHTQNRNHALMWINP
jgi:hypothetical protein